MSKVFEGDEWKYVPEPKEGGPTRAEAQSIVNARYALGLIDREEWRKATDELGEPTKWTAKGRIR